MRSGRRERPWGGDWERRRRERRRWRRRVLAVVVALVVVSSGVVVAAVPGGGPDGGPTGEPTTLAQVEQLPDGGLPLPPGTTENSVCGLSLQYGTVTLDATTGFFEGIPFLFADPLSQGLFLVANFLDFANLGDGLTGLTLDCEIFVSEAAPDGGSFGFSLNDQESPVGFCAAVDGDQSSILCTQAEQEGQLWVFTSTGDPLVLLSTALSGAPVTVQFYQDGLPAPALGEVAPTPTPVDTTVSFLHTNGELTAWDGLPIPTEELQPGESALDAPGTHVVVAREPGASEFTYYRVVDGDVLELPPLDGRVVRDDVPEPAPFLFVAEDTGTDVTGVDHRGNEFDESFFGLPPLVLPPPDELANPNLPNVICSQFSSPLPTSDLLVGDLSAADRAAVGLDGDTQAVLVTLPATPSAEAPISWAVGGCNVRTFEDPLAALVGSTADGGGIGVDPRTPDGRAALGLDTVVYHAGVDGTDGERIQGTFDAELNEIELDPDAVTPEPPSGLSVELLPGTDDPIRYALAPIPLQVEIPIEGFVVGFEEFETDDGFELEVDVGDERDVLFTRDIGPPPRFFTPEAGADRGDAVDEQADYALVSRVQTADGGGTVSVGTSGEVVLVVPAVEGFRYGLPRPEVDVDSSEVPSGFTCTALYAQLPDGVSDEPSLFRPSSPPDIETSIVVFPAFDDAPGSLGVSVDYGVAPCPNEPQAPGGEPPATSIMTEMKNKLVIA